MIVDRDIRVVAAADTVFAQLMDIPLVGACLPGAQEVQPDETEPDCYRGLLEVRIGPVTVTLRGTVRIARSDPEARSAVLRLHGRDRRIGGEVTGDMLITITASSDTDCVLNVHTDVTVSGKLGQFGQAVMTKKADQIVDAFVAEFSRRVTDDAGTPTLGAPTSVALPAHSTPKGERPHAPTRPPFGSPHAAAYAVVSLLRHSRTITLPGARTNRRYAAPSWVVPGEPLPTGPVVLELAVENEGALSSALGSVPTGGGPVVVALRAQGGAVGAPESFGQLVATALAAGFAVLPVARTPWNALAIARVATAASAPGMALRFDAPHAGSLLRAAVTEIREAGLELPVIAGVVAPGNPADSLLASGADGVIVDAPGPRRWRAPRPRRIAALGR